MATQIVMDNSGDSRHNFDPKGLKGSLGSRGTLQTADGLWLYGGSPYPVWRASYNASI